MPTITVRLTQNGSPVEGATVYAGAFGAVGTTSAAGTITRSVSTGWGPRPLLIMYEITDPVTGDVVASSGGSYLVRPGTTLELGD